MKIYIHNILSESGTIVEAICDTLSLKYSATISFNSDDLYDYEIEIDHLSIVPFMIRFFHKIDNAEYERMEII